MPVRCDVNEPVNDCFDEMEVGGAVVDWNTYSPVWAPVSVAACPGQGRKCLTLRDRDPCDYAKAERVFPPSKQVTVRFGVLAAQRDAGQLQGEILDARGRVAFRLVFDSDGRILVHHGTRMHVLGGYAAQTWYQVALDLDTHARCYDLAVGELSVRGAPFVEPMCSSMERILLRTGSARTTPALETDRHAGEDLPGADEPVPEAVFYIDGLRTSGHDA